jgi:hypothetical protein
VSAALLRGPAVAVCYVVAFWSGFFVMGVELLGGRILAPNFGSSIYVWGALITVFMLALSLGYLAGGRWSQRDPSLRRLGLLLAVAALTALPVLPLAGTPLEELSIRIQDPRFGSLAAAVLLFSSRPSSREWCLRTACACWSMPRNPPAAVRASCTSSRPSAAPPARC